jgi:hypothetical protein
MVKRQAVASIESQKYQMIAALYANSAFDESEEGIKARAERIKGLEEHFTKAIELVYHPELHRDETPEIDWDNPFWAAAKRAQQRRMERFAGENDGTTVGQVVEMDKEQLEARQRSRRSIDQL